VVVAEWPAVAEPFWACLNCGWTGTAVTQDEASAEEPQVEDPSLDLLKDVLDEPAPEGEPLGDPEISPDAAPPLDGHLD
jgi:hypothetical protein